MRESRSPPHSSHRLSLQEGKEHANHALRPFPPIPSPFQGEGEGEGDSSTTSLGRLKDGSQHGIGAAEDVVVPEAEYSISCLDQNSCPLRIGGVANHVLGAIKLYDKLALGASEVHNVASNRVLTSELEPSEPPVPQVPPDESLSVC